eukprot:12428244-Alexandrium_andersonii.AAC.1
MAAQRLRPPAGARRAQRWREERPSRAEAVAARRGCEMGERERRLPSRRLVEEAAARKQSQ